MKNIAFLFTVFFALLLDCHLFSAHTIDLSSPPENRWGEIVNQYDRDSLRKYAAMIDKAISDESFVLEFSWVRKMIMDYGWSGSMETDEKWFSDLQLEIRGLSKALKDHLGEENVPGFNEEDLFIFNIGYDFSTYCTSGVFQTNEGPILFRNLDWEGDEYRDFAVEVDFEKDGRSIFKSIQFLGHVGVFTALKPNAYAIALNYRKTPGTGTFGWEIVHNISQFMFNDGWSSSILIRYALEHDRDFSEAKERLETTELLSPCYYIIAGVKSDEGAIIERGRESNHTRDFSDPLENPKFIVQTNHDVPLPEDQDENWAGDDVLLNESMGMGTISRREAAVSFLQSIDESALEIQLMQMLTSHHPVYNPLTIFSSIWNPRNNQMKWVVHPADVNK